MGWASGSSLLEAVARAVMPHVEEGDRPRLAGELIDLFEGEDCDTICEVTQKDIAKEYERRNPETDG